LFVGRLHARGHTDACEDDWIRSQNSRAVHKACHSLDLFKTNTKFPIAYLASNAAQRCGLHFWLTVMLGKPKCMLRSEGLGRKGSELRLIWSAFGPPRAAVSKVSSMSSTRVRANRGQRRLVIPLRKIDAHILMITDGTLQ